MSDRLAVMRAGRIEQIGAPQAVYDAPDSTYVADFLGLANLLPAVALDADEVEIAGQCMRAPVGDARGSCTVFVRPERVQIVPIDDGSFTGTVRDVVFVGSMSHIHVNVGGNTLMAVVSNDGATAVPTPGTTVGVSIPPDAVRLLESEPN